MLWGHVLVSACSLDAVACKGNLINLLNLWWVDSGQCLSPHPGVGSLLYSDTGERIKGAEVRKSFVRSKEGLDVVQALLSDSSKFDLLSALCSHVSKRQHHSGCFEGNSLHCNYTQCILSLKVSKFCYFTAHRVIVEYLFFKELNTCFNPSSWLTLPGSEAFAARGWF